MTDMENEDENTTGFLLNHAADVSRQLDAPNGSEDNDADDDTDLMANISYRGAITILFLHGS